MNTIDTSDALDFTKENIRPLKQGRKPIQLETALQAQSNMEIQQQLNKDKEIFEHNIRTYEGEDPLAPRCEYIKWLEQIYLKHGPGSNLLPLIEETVQKFKNNPKYKQDPRFIQILINFIENQPNAAELYQTAFNQGLGTMCALFYRSWADLLERHNDFKRVDQIFSWGIKAKAEPIKDLEEAHLQFQLSIARRALNGQLSCDEEKNSEVDKRQAFNLLKSSETHSGIRHGLGGGVGGNVPQLNNVNGKISKLQIFEDNEENGLFGVDNNDCELAPKGLNKENTVNPGPWSKPKKSRSKVLKPVSTVNFEVHQDKNVENVTKLSGITVPNALRSIKGSATITCPVAVFEPPDPTKRPMYCKDKVYAAGRDVQLEEIRYEMYLKQEKEKLKGKRPISAIKSLQSEITAKPLKKLIHLEENSKTNDFKVPLALQTEPDPLSQSVTVNTRAAIDLVQQMWNSPCSDKAEELTKDRNTHLFNGLDKNDNNSKQYSPELIIYEDKKMPITGIKTDKVNDKVLKIQQNKTRTTDDFYVYTDDDDQIKNTKISEVYIDENCENQVKRITIPDVYIDENQVKSIKTLEVYNDENYVKNVKTLEVYNDENQVKNVKIPEVYIDENDANPSKKPTFMNNPRNKEQCFKIPEVYVDDDENKVQINTKSIKGQDYTVYEDERENHLSTRTKETTNSEIVGLTASKNTHDEENDDITCSTKAFAFVLCSSTPLAPKRTKPIDNIENHKKPLMLVEENKNKETVTEEFHSGKSLSMILEASKERNSSTSSGMISKLDQPSIDFGDSINPFDNDLTVKLLKKIVKFPNEKHMSGYVEYKSDIPSMRSEFKLGPKKMSFLGELGKGAYARVVRVRTNDENAVEKALKIEKPACAWEWYISKEIQHRLKDSEKICYFINMDFFYGFNNGSIISMDFAPYGTLLSVVRAYKSSTNQSVPVPVAALLISQITSAIKYLHECQIIHGDLKPDNVILKSLPNESFLPCVQIIDFGRSIDMTLYPPDTTFTYSVKTADFICHEMRNKLPWTYQTDYYGLAGIIYMVLMSDYMKTQKLHKAWVLSKPFHRYVDKNLWDGTMKTLLNIESCKNLPNLDQFIKKLNKYLSDHPKVLLKNNYSSFNNVLMKL